MKKINKIFYGLLALGCMFLFACNEEWKDEQYEKTVSFAHSGYTDVYLKYGTEGGIVPYKIPVIVSGSTTNDRNIEVFIALDPDTLTDLNFDRFRLRDDLYFKQLDEKYYTFKSMKTTIAKGSDIGLIDIDFKLNDLDMVDRYILPIQIVSTSEYMPSPRKWYKKSMMRIVPFNDYSGVYKPSKGEVLFEGSTRTTIPLEDWRDASVVDEKTIFFYAGFIDEKARDRAMYKIKAQFNADMTVTLTADSAQTIHFSQLGGSYYITTTNDPSIPYIERRYVTMELDYRFSDVTNPDYVLPYRITGSYTMERVRNTLIPEEDQQFIFD